MVEDMIPYESSSATITREIPREDVPHGDSLTQLDASCPITNGSEDHDTEVPCLARSNGVWLSTVGS